jgi:hypothetical protein
VHKAVVWVYCGLYQTNYFFGGGKPMKLKKRLELLQKEIELLREIKELREQIASAPVVPYQPYGTWTDNVPIPLGGPVAPCTGDLIPDQPFTVTVALTATYPDDVAKKVVDRLRGARSAT